MQISPRVKQEKSAMEECPPIPSPSTGEMQNVPGHEAEAGRTGSAWRWRQASQTAETPERQLSRDALLGIIIGVAGIGGAVFELGWIARAVLVLFAIGLTIYAARRHSAHAAVRAFVAILVVMGFVGLSAQPIWQDFHSKYPSVVLSKNMQGLLSPYVVAQKQEPAKPTPIPETTSNAGRTIYRCTPQGRDSPKSIEKAEAAYKDQMAIYGDTFGLNINVADVLGGIRMEATPKLYRDFGPIKTTIEVRNIGNDTYVIRTQTFPEPNAKWFAMGRTILGSEDDMKLRKTISQMPGVDISTCQLL